MPSHPEARAEARRRRKARLRRQRIGAAAVLVAGAGAAVGWGIFSGGGSAKVVGRTPAPPPVAASRVVPARLVERPLGQLPESVSGAAAAALPDGRAMLLGGLSAADASTTAIQLVRGSRGTILGQLPLPLHDAAAAAVEGAVYLFGGGTATRQLDTILRIDPATGRSRQVGRLPAASSDLAAAVVDGTVYLVGGFDGQRFLDTVLAWRPGRAPRVAARLPQGLRYAAVAAADGRVVIAGGSTPAGASDRVLTFDPGSGRVSRIGRLPVPTTHAAAAALDGHVYVLGGRGEARGSAVRRIVAVDARSGRARPAGHLALALSDLCAMSGRSGILAAGGLGPAGTSASVSRLVPGSAPTATETANTHVENVYRRDGAGMLSPVVRRDRPLVYVPNSQSGSVDVIDPRTFRVVDHFGVGELPQHVTPSWDLRTLYVLNDVSNSVTTIDPRTGRPGRTIPVDDPYNMYFTQDGRFAIVVAERNARLDFRDPHTMKLRHSLAVPCRGVDHMDFTADGRYALASCEFSGEVLQVDIPRQRVIKTITLGGGQSMPQDVKLSPDGRVFYVADMLAGGLYEIDARTFRRIGFLPTGRGVHGLYPSRDAKLLYASNRGEGSVSVISFRTRRVLGKWRIPGGGSPDMGGVSADGRTLWLTGRYSGEVYAIDTRTGRLRARIPVGAGPHGLAVWPQPGRYSLGHTGVLR